MWMVQISKYSLKSLLNYYNLSLWCPYTLSRSSLLRSFGKQTDSSERVVTCVHGSRRAQLMMTGDQLVWAQVWWGQMLSLIPTRGFLHIMSNQPALKTGNTWHSMFMGFNQWEYVPLFLSLISRCCTKRERWRFSALDKFVLDRHTDIVTPWVPDGAKNSSCYAHVHCTYVLHICILKQQWNLEWNSSRLGLYVVWFISGAKAKGLSFHDVASSLSVINRFLGHQMSQYLQSC